MSTDPETLPAPHVSTLWGVTVYTRGTMKCSISAYYKHSQAVTE